MHSDTVVTLFVMVVGFLATMLSNHYNVETLRKEMGKRIDDLSYGLNKRIDDLTSVVNHFIDLHITLTEKVAKLEEKTK